MFKFEFYWSKCNLAYHTAWRNAPHADLTPLGVWFWLRFPRLEVNFLPHKLYSPEWIKAVNTLPGPHFASDYPPARRCGTKVQFRIWKWAKPHTSYANKWLELMIWVPFNIGR